MLGGNKMDMNLVIVVYFLIVLSTVLTLVMIKDKQVLGNLLEKKDIQQEEITELKLEKIRLKHTIKMQDETIAHMLTTNSLKKDDSVEASVNESADQEWHLDEYKSMSQEYYQL
ncbi:hypothetical protein RV18_GL003347 [Enterococcus termitis]|nr:hypothetical protein RV18_GL003347 [Enterococcus termitis]